MLNFLHLPLEIRLQIYAELESPQPQPISLGQHFAAEPAYRFPPHILRVSRQVNHEALMVLAPTSKRPWKITVDACPNAKLSLPNGLPHGLAHSAYIQFDFKFPCESDTIPESLEPWSDLNEMNRMTLCCLIWTHRLSTFSHVGRGMDRLCRRLAEVPVKRDIKICWYDFSLIKKSVEVKSVLRPFSMFWSLGTFRFGEVTGGQEEEELARYIKTITARNPKYGIMKCD